MYICIHIYTYIHTYIYYDHTQPHTYTHTHTHKQTHIARKSAETPCKDRKRSGLSTVRESPDRYRQGSSAASTYEASPGAPRTRAGPSRTVSGLFPPRGQTDRERERETDMKETFKGSMKETDTVKASMQDTAANSPRAQQHVRVQLLVPRAKMGLLIGREGKNIRELLQEAFFSLPFFLFSQGKSIG